MKKLLFTLLLNVSFILVNAQTNNEVIKGETLNCRTNELNNLTVSDSQLQTNKVQTENKVVDTKSKNKKHFIKKVLSNFQGADIKDAWSVVSIN